jgi:hypothetical protein
MSDINNANSDESTHHETGNPNENSHNASNVIDNEANEIISSIDLPELELNEADVNDLVLTDKAENSIFEEEEETTAQGYTAETSFNIEPVEIGGGGGLNSLEAQVINNTHEALDRVHDDTDDSDASSDNYNISSPKLQLQSVDLESERPTVRLNNQPSESNNNDEDIDIDDSFAQHFRAGVESNERQNDDEEEEVNVDDVSLDSENQNTVDSRDSEAATAAVNKNADQVCVFHFCA